MEKIIFNDRRINKSNFYLNEKPFFIHDIDFSKILISKKDSYGKNVKYFIGYNDDDAIRPLCLKLPHKWLIMLNTLIPPRQGISRLLKKGY